MTLHQEIKQTINYSAFFADRLTPKELHHWLITDNPVSFTRVKGGLTPKTTKLLATKEKDQTLVNEKLSTIKRALTFLESIPTINLIALTGSLAINNPKKNDDIDLMIITNSNTLWLTRLLVLPFIRLFFKTRLPQTKVFSKNAICLNLWLDTKALEIPDNKKNLYTAHEVLQIRPLFNRGNTYQQFILHNSWTREFLANAYEKITKNFSNRYVEKASPTASIFIPINYLAFKLQYFYMHSKMTKEYITLHEAYFHPKDVSSKIGKRFKVN